MDTIQNFIKTEWIKLRTYKQFWFYSALPFLVILLHFFFALNSGKQGYDDYCLTFGNKNPWYYYYGNILLITTFLIAFWISIGMLIGSQLENRARSWKHILTLPIPIKHILLTKQILFILYLGLICFLMASFLVGTGYVFKMMMSEINFDNYPTKTDFVFVLFFKYWLASWGVVVLHFWISILFPNVLLSILLPFVGLLLGDYFIYSLTGSIFREYSMKEIKNGANLTLAEYSVIDTYVLIGMGSGIFLLFLSFVLFKNKYVA